MPFAKLSTIVKPQTNGYIRLTATDGTSEVTLSDYAPVETTPSYRNYYIPSLWRPQVGICNRVVLARARKRFVPVSEDRDMLIISNIKAGRGHPEEGGHWLPRQVPHASDLIHARLPARGAPESPLMNHEQVQSGRLGGAGSVGWNH